MAGRPLNGRNRGKHVLAAMKALSPNLHESLVEIWDTVIPKLTQFLDGELWILSLCMPVRLSQH